MNDKFHLETYREHEIWYNADTDKFTVELLVECSWHDKGRKSMKDCRKVIDEHIKANFEFKPIKCIRKRSSSSNGEVITVNKVRADGGFILNDGVKEQTEISEVLNQIKGKEIKYFTFSVDYIEWLDKFKSMENRHKAERMELNNQEPKLEPLDLSFVKAIANIN